MENSDLVSSCFRGLFFHKTLKDLWRQCGSMADMLISAAFISQFYTEENQRYTDFCLVTSISAFGNAEWEYKIIIKCQPYI